jgi:LPXTG-site transpeptidase (sortase) family protein
MDFKNRPQPRTAPRRVVLSDYTERSLRARPQRERIAPRQLPQSISDVVHASSQHIQPAEQFSDMKQTTKHPAIDIVQAQPYARPAKPKLQRSNVLIRTATTRQSPVEPVNSATPKKESSRFNKTQLLLLSMSVVVFVAGMFVTLDTLLTNHSAKTQVAALSKKVDAAVVSTSGGQPSVDVPSETKPPASSSKTYQVAPNLPKLITIDALGVNARVKSVGVTASNELGTPASIYDTGWYNASAKPGDGGGSGAMLIDGHVHGPTLPGVFVGIKKLAVGDVIQVTRGDNTIFKYAVVKTETVSADSVDVGKLLTSVRPGKPALNLITCGGKFNANTQHYEDRVIVYAVQI